MRRVVSCGSSGYNFREERDFATFAVGRDTREDLPCARGQSDVTGFNDKLSNCPDLDRANGLPAESCRAALRRGFTAFDEGRRHAGAAEPRLLVTDTVSIDDTPAAFEALRKRTHQCKVLIAP